MPRVVHFEIHADDPERAARFYTGLFEWEFPQWPGPMPYWMVKTGPDHTPGINGGLVQRQHVKLGSDGIIAYVCTVDVENLDAYIVRAVELGGSIELPKMPIPGVGWLAYLKDTEGNIFGMMQSDPTAS